MAKTEFMDMLADLQSILHETQFFKPEFEDAIDEVIGYVDELEKQLAESKGRRKAQAVHLDQVQTACHKAKESLFHVKRKLFAAEQQIKVLGGIPPMYVPENYGNGSRSERLRRAKEQIAELEKRLVKANEALQVMVMMRTQDKVEIEKLKNTLSTIEYLSGWKYISAENGEQLTAKQIGIEYTDEVAPWTEEQQEIVMERFKNKLPTELKND